MSTLDESFDLLTCFKCLLWPVVASEWSYRSRFSQSYLISKMVDESALLVPIGIKFGSITNSTVELRILFCRKNDDIFFQHSLYAIECYFVLKDVINKNLKIFYLLTFWKLCCFWTIKQTTQYNWTIENLLFCFSFCSQKLIYFVNIGYCPFIPQFYLFEGKVIGRAKSDLIAF